MTNPDGNDNQEGQGKEHNSCPKCGKIVLAKAGLSAATPHLSVGEECVCDTVQNVSAVNAGGETIAPGSKAEDKKTQLTLPTFQSDPSIPNVNMSQTLTQLRHTQEGITFTKQDARQINKNLIELKEGAIIGGIYRIDKRLGRGNMGEVYLAEHIMLGKKCALKIIPPQLVSEASWLRFQVEAKAVAQLNHLNLVKVTDLGIHENCLPFYAMEYVEGETLEELLQDQKTLPLNTALEIFIQICNALEYAHAHNIVHRDIKPANIMLTAGPIGKDAVKVLDFGLAKLTQQDAQQQQHQKHRLTSAGEIFGSPPYMSPEQCMGGEIDSRSDIYSLGCTLFEVLTGRPVFEGTLASTLLYNHEKIPAPSLTSVSHKTFPEAMEIVMARMLRKDPLERYQTMAAVRQDLEMVLHGSDVLPLGGGGGRNFVPTNIPYKKATSEEYFQKDEKDAEDSDNEDYDYDEDLGDREEQGRNTRANVADNKNNAGEGLLQTLTAYRPPKMVLIPVSILLIGLIGAYWFYTKHEDSQYIARPMVTADASPVSASDTRAFSSIVTENGKRIRRFNFPQDAEIGKIRSQSSLVVAPALGQVDYGENDKLYFFPSNIVIRYPNYMMRFRTGDVYAVALPASDNGDGLLKAAAVIPDVQKLVIYRCQSVTNRGLQAIELFDHLDDLDISYNPVDIGYIGRLTRLKDLNTIRLSGGKNIAPVLQTLAHSRALREMHLDECPLTPELLGLIASIPGLTTLTCNADKLTDEDLTILSKSPKLRYLSILQTPLTKNTATILKTFPSLKVLTIVNEQSARGSVTPQLAALRRALPGLQVN